jgi:hypothetical protein
MVKVQRAELGDTTTQFLSKGEGLTEREMKLEDQNKEQRSKYQSKI